MDIILHCGEHKTGSTSIQTALFLCKEELLRCSILYDDANERSGHYDLAYLVGRGRKLNEKEALEKTECAKESFVRLKDKIDLHGPDYLLLSSENFFSFPSNDLHAILKLFDGMYEKAHVIVYIRCPVSYYMSSVQQYIKGGHVFPAPDTYKKNTAQNLLALREVVGHERFHVGIFDRKTLRQGCVVNDFSQVLREVSGAPVAALPVVKTNVSLAAEQMIVLQSYRRDFLPHSDRSSDASVDGIIRFFNELKSRKALPLSRPSLSAVAKDALYESARSCCRDVDAQFHGLGFEEVCFADASARGPSASRGQWSGVASILAEYDADLVRVLKSCIPAYNKILARALAGDFLDAGVAQNKSFYESLGNYLFSECHFKVAGMSFMKALQFDADDALMHVNVGRSFLRMGQIGDAMRWGLKAMALKGDEPEAYFFLGEVLSAGGDVEGAKTFFRKGAQLAG